MSLIVSAFSPVIDARLSVTPQLNPEADALLVLLDLGRGANRMGASALAQACGQTGDTVPDIDSAADLKAFFTLVQRYLGQGQIMAYHDRSDGGLLTTLLEMAFAGRCGLEIELSELSGGCAGKIV